MGRHKISLLLGAGLLGLVLLGPLLLPWAAWHFGFAAPSVGGLPYRIEYVGRIYAAADCSVNAQARCYGLHLCASQASLRADALWPLVQVGVVPAWPDSPPPILAQTTQGLQFFLVVPNGEDCYVTYGLQGGP